jgi:hypothetical protein
MYLSQARPAGYFLRAGEVPFEFLVIICYQVCKFDRRRKKA